MNLTRISLSNPVAVIVGILLVSLFGLISITRLPIQLIPVVERPVIKITTNWRAAAPREVESEIIEPQEDVLRGLPGMTRLTSESSRGRGNIEIDEAFQEVFGEGRKGEGLAQFHSAKPLA